MEDHLDPTEEQEEAPQPQEVLEQEVPESEAWENYPAVEVVLLQLDLGC